MIVNCHSTHTEKWSRMICKLLDEVVAASHVLAKNAADVKSSVIEVTPAATV